MRFDQRKKLKRAFNWIIPESRDSMSCPPSDSLSIWCVKSGTNSMLSVWQCYRVVLKISDRICEVVVVRNQIVSNWSILNLFRSLLMKASFKVTWFRILWATLYFKRVLPLNLSLHMCGLDIRPCIPGQYKLEFCLWLAIWAAAAAAWCRSSNLK